MARRLAPSRRSTKGVYRTPWTPQYRPRRRPRPSLAAAPPAGTGLSFYNGTTYVTVASVSTYNGTTYVPGTWTKL